jgi:arylsulfatase
LVDPATHPLPQLMGRGPDWNALDEAGREQESMLMAVHAAMVDRVDQGVGAILRALEETGRRQDTIVFVLADNGASPERYTDAGFDRPSATRDGRLIRYTGRFSPGPETTWGYISAYWANAVNTPYRYWKAESFEGGCHTPMIVAWPGGSMPRGGSTTGGIGHVIDLMPTCLELAGVDYPARYNGHDLKPLEGRSLAPILRGQAPADDRTLYFEHEGGRAVISDGWKLVARARGPWELYHLAEDATETSNLAEQQPQRVSELAGLWRDWWRRVAH